MRWDRVMDGATRDDLAVVAEGSPVEVPGLPALPGGLARQMTSSLYPPYLDRVSRLAEYPRTRQLHRAEADAPHGCRPEDIVLKSP